MIHRLAEEAGAGHCSDAYQPGQILAEFQIAVIAEFGNVQQDIIRPLRIVVDDVQIIQSLEESCPNFSPGITASCKEKG